MDLVGLEGCLGCGSVYTWPGPMWGCWRCAVCEGTGKRYGVCRKDVRMLHRHSVGLLGRMCSSLKRDVKIV